MNGPRPRPKRRGGCLRVLVGAGMWCAVAAEVAAQCAPSAPVISDPRITYAVAGQPIVLRVHVEACGVVYPEATATLTGQVLEVGVLADRVFTGCQPAREQSFTLPAVPAGAYVLNLLGYPSSLGSCPSFDQVPFGVLPPVATAVPVLGARLGLLLSMGALLLGWFTLRRRQA